MKINFFVIAFICNLFYGYSQTINITGKIVDDNTNLPVVGANIVIKNTIKSDQSDFDGRLAL